MILKSIDDLAIFCKISGDPDLEDLAERMLEGFREFKDDENERDEGN